MAHRTRSRSTLRRLLSAAAAVALAAAAGCSSSTVDGPPRDDESGEVETRNQSTGESSEAFVFDAEGDAARPLPSYSERLGLHLMNRFRLDPGFYGIATMQGPVPPQLPLIPDPSLVEAGRWQANHVLDQKGEAGNCLCPQFQPQPMGPGQGACCLPESAEQACEITTEGACDGDFRSGNGCGTACPLFDRKNTCCTMTRNDGKVECQPSEVDVTCDDEQNATTQQRRWELLATGSSNISDELYQRAQLPSQSALPEIPGQLIACWAIGGCSPPTVALQPPQPFLDRGVSSFGIGQVSDVIVPEECQEPEDTCQVGTCTDPSTGDNLCDEETNPECSGICRGEACNGRCIEDGEPVSCELPTPPDEEECQPSEFDRKYYISYVHGGTQEPIPTLVDGIHYQLGRFTGDLFESTSEAQTGFGIHYFEPAGDAQSANVVVDGSCESLEVEKRNVTEEMEMASNHLDGGVSRDAKAGDVDSGDASGMDTGSDTNTDTSPGDTGRMDAADAGPGMNFWGTRYGTEVDLETGCHRYVFVFEDADGFTHTYPRYGSLGANIETIETEDGSTRGPVANDEDCPIWSTERPDLSCLQEGDQCAEGETRQCYTGRDNTRGQGICELGTEQCVNGRWSGVCEGEVTPESSETCGDGLDNDCNGFVDENCGSDTPDAGMSDDTGGTGDAGDAGGGDISPISPGNGGGGDSGCGLADGGGPSPLAPALAVAVGLVALRIRRGRRDSEI